MLENKWIVRHFIGDGPAVEGNVLMPAEEIHKNQMG
jgi:hypothetical protein